MYIIKKDGTIQSFDINKVVSAVKKSAERSMYIFSAEDIEFIKKYVLNKASDYAKDHNNKIPVHQMHIFAENALDDIDPKTARCYREYRNYKIDFGHMLDSVYRKAEKLRYDKDRSNANTDSTQVASQRAIVYGYLNSEFYDTFFLNDIERQAIRDGYIYIHDKKDRRDGFNCILADVGNILKGGFELGNQWYEEPTTLSSAFSVISDVTMSASAQQYGGFTIPRIDSILAPYAEKSYKKYYDEYLSIVSLYTIRYDEDIKKAADEYAANKVYRDFEQGFQSWEYKFNTVASSRGDYPFIACSFGIDISRWGVMATLACLRVRAGGQGKKGFKKAVLFPKLTFLYDENLHGEGKEFEYVFLEAIECNKKAMYPDYLSLTGEGYIPSMYKKYGKVVSLMGCRASLSPWYIRGGMEPADEDDEPVFEGRFNLGAISLNLPMILAKAREEEKDFYKVLDYYLEMIRSLHKKTYEYFGEKRASTNPLIFTQGGCYNGYLNPDDKVKPLLAPMTMSFGITALNELNRLYNGKSIYEDGCFPLEVMKYINEKVDTFKHEDGILYAIYGTPAESLAGLQVEQFRKKYGIIKNVSDKAYFSNSFHCHVTEDITPIQKQDSEARFWNYFNGGKIQYCKYPINYNTNAYITLIRRGMKYGFYEGVNLNLAYCEDCGYEELNMDICPKCGSSNISKMARMNGYLGWDLIKGQTRYNNAKHIEISERVSM